MLGDTLNGRQHAPAEIGRCIFHYLLTGPDANTRNQGVVPFVEGGENRGTREVHRAGIGGLIHIDHVHDHLQQGLFSFAHLDFVLAVHLLEVAAAVAQGQVHDAVDRSPEGNGRSPLIHLAVAVEVLGQLLSHPPQIIPGPGILAGGQLNACFFQDILVVQYD